MLLTFSHSEAKKTRSIFRNGAHVRRTMERRLALRGEPLISVIVPAHRESHYILATLQSLARQQLRDAEFLVISNGEPCGNRTQRLAEAAGFTVIYERKGGVGRARQCGLRAARGRILVSTDADTLHSAQWLSAIAEQCRNNPFLVAGYGFLYPLSQSLVQMFCRQVQNVSRSWQGNSVFFTAPEANCWFLRAPALRVGGFDAAARYAEGPQLLRKLTAFGEVQSLPDPRAAAYTSDRRELLDRVWAVTQYAFGGNSQNMEYAVVR